jgi:hypothetical protein
VNKKPLIGVSILVVVLLVLGSLSNVVGYQSVQSSNHSVIQERINQKELLFQTIVDIANNKEIQRIILKSQINRGGFFNPGARISLLNTPVLTKNQLRQMYLIGLLLSKFISRSRIHSMVEQYQLNNQGLQKEISAVIEKNAKIKEELTQLSDMKCDCESENTTRLWHFPVLCYLVLLPLFLFGCVLFNIGYESKIPIISNYLQLIGFIFMAGIALISGSQYSFECTWWYWFY